MKRKQQRGFKLIELLVATATIAILGSILFPVFKQSAFAKGPSSADNLKKITQASVHYGDDYDERIPIIINGPYRDLKNIRDGALTQYGEQRSDMWPLLLVPYLKDRTRFVDPTRTDKTHIFSGPPLASSDPGYDMYGATYRNQSRFPFYGVNYAFLSPFLIPASKMTDPTPTDFMAGEVHRFFQAYDPANTVFYAPTFKGRLPQSKNDHIGIGDPNTGYYGANAPGLWNALSASTTPYVEEWTGTDCSADWCGTDLDPNTPGVQTSQSFFYEDPRKAGNNVSFLDGHVRFAKTLDLAAGTDYLTANVTKDPSGTRGGGCVILDKRKYIWNLDDNYYGE